MKLKDFAKENKGFSLVELVVTILMMGLVSLMLVTFISSSRRNYTNLSTEVQLQNEANFAMSYIGDVAVEAEEFTAMESFNDGRTTLDAFCIKAPDSAAKIVSAKDYYYFIARERVTDPTTGTEEGTLRFIKLDGSQVSMKTVKDADDNDVVTIDVEKTLREHKVSGEGRHLLAKHSKDMNVEIDGSLIKITINFELLGEEYCAYKVVSGRNIK